MMIDDNFVHSDLHPGNLLVLYSAFIDSLFFISLLIYICFFYSLLMLAGVCAGAPNQRPPYWLWFEIVNKDSNGFVSPYYALELTLLCALCQRFRPWDSWCWTRALSPSLLIVTKSILSACIVYIIISSSMITACHLLKIIGCFLFYFVFWKQVNDQACVCFSSHILPYPFCRLTNHFLCFLCIECFFTVRFGQLATGNGKVAGCYWW